MAADPQPQSPAKPPALNERQAAPDLDVNRAEIEAGGAVAVVDPSLEVLEAPEAIPDEVWAQADRLCGGSGEGSEARRRPILRLNPQVRRLLGATFDGEVTRDVTEGAEVLLKAQRAGYRIVQVGVTHFRRRAGGSRYRIREIVMTMIQMVGLWRELRRS